VIEVRQTEMFARWLANLRDGRDKRTQGDDIAMAIKLARDL
jgi:putative component of toxin-antitoxin plasmid stabilization module